MEQTADSGHDGTHGLRPRLPCGVCQPLRPGVIGMIVAAWWQGQKNARKQENSMLKFLGGTIGVIFLIGLIVVILLLMLIF